MSDPHVVILIGIFFVMVLQFTQMAMLQHLYAHKHVRVMSKMLQAQNERIAALLQMEIKEGTDAAHAAYKEANSINLKIEDLNKQLLAEHGDKAKEK